MRRQAIAIIAGVFLVANLGSPAAYGDSKRLIRPQLLKKINIFKKAIQLPGKMARFPLRIKRVLLEAKERGGMLQIVQDRGIKEGLNMARTGFELTSRDHEKQTSATFLDHVGHRAGPRSAGVALAKRSTDKSRHWLYGALAGAKASGLFTWATFALHNGHAELAQSAHFGSTPDYTIPAVATTLITGAVTLGVRHISKRYGRRAKQREMIGIAHELLQEGTLAQVLTKDIQAAAKSNKFMSKLRKIARTKKVEPPTSTQIIEGLLTAIADERKVAMKKGKSLLPRSYTDDQGIKKFGRQFNPEKIINVELYPGKAKTYLSKLDKLEQAVLQIHGAMPSTSTNSAKN